MTHALTSPLTISWRVSVGQYEADEAFEDLLGLVRANLDWLDEIAFFETVTHHLYLTPEVLAERTAVLGRRVAAMRQAGARSVGINVLTTIGHINEAWDTMTPLPFQPMVGHDGAVSRGCACPNTSGLREYVRAKYTLVAQAAPDFVWVDDDIRMNNHGVAWACFCPTCLAILSTTLGQEFTREALVAALGDPARGDVREAWVQQNADTVAGLLADVASAIHAVDPDIATGLMTAGPGDVYAGADLHRWMRWLRATKLRPGGGFYTDATPMAMVGKALDTGRGARVVADMPEVADIQYELEDFPYQKLRKSATALVAECTLALAAGCNGVALNMLPMWGGPFDEVEAFLPRLRAVRPEWERFVAAAAGLPTAGLWPAWHPKILSRRLMRPGDGWFADTGAFGAGTPYLLAEIGLPLSLEPWDGVGQPACGVVLAGRMVEVFSDEELRSILSGGVLMDTAALEVLTERGLGEYAGVRIARRIDNGAMEQFTDDPLNGKHAGQIRDARIEFWGDARGKADVLEPLGDGVRMLAELRDYSRRPMGPCLSAYENRLGGRVVVMGYAQWMFLQSVPKRAQLQNVADWLTGGTLPVRVEEAVPLVPFARMPEDRSRAVVVLLNAGLDTLEKATVRIRLADGECTEVVTDLAPWTTRVLVVG
jgi:hypothetical protein